MSPIWSFWVYLSNIVSLAISIDNDRLHFSKKKQFLQDFLFIAKFYKNFKSVFMGFAFWGDGSIPNDSKERSFFSLILQNPKMVVLNRERQFKPSHQLICCSHKKD